MPPGGKRAGAGRPKGPPTKVLCVRVPVSEYDWLLPKVGRYVKRLLRRKIQRAENSV